MCHGADLQPPDPDYPALTGRAFDWAWRGRTLQERFSRMQGTMPPAARGQLRAEDYLAILTFILQSNGIPAGASALPADPAVLLRIMVPRLPQ